MVKKTKNRDINPADAHRKKERAKEIARNKKERKFLREAHALKANPEDIKEKLKEVIAVEESGNYNLTIRLKKRALQGAYETAVKKGKEEELSKHATPVFANSYGHGVLDQRPEDSVYWHPTLNPEGLPPAGKPQRYKTGAPLALPQPPLASSLPVPKPPPLPAGPAPRGLPVPAPPPLPAGPKPGAAGVLPPPSGPPPGVAGRGDVLPPPSGPPPGVAALPPPPGPPPGVSVMPPPPGAPPGVHPPPPSGDGGAGPSSGGMAPPMGPPPGRPMGMGMMPPPSRPPPGMMYMMPPPGMPPPGYMQGYPMGPPPGPSARVTQSAAQLVAPAPTPTATPTPQAQPQEKAPVGQTARSATIAAASTVVKLPKAHQDKSVTSMVPPSVRIQRERAAAPIRPQARIREQAAQGFGLAPSLAPAPAPKPQKAGGTQKDLMYKNFLEEMAELGAIA